MPLQRRSPCEREISADRAHPGLVRITASAWPAPPHLARHLSREITDPHEREPVSLPHPHSWTGTHFNRIIGEFHASLRSLPSCCQGRSRSPVGEQFCAEAAVDADAADEDAVEHEQPEAAPGHAGVGGIP